jgi:hypothetical protein
MTTREEMDDRPYQDLAMCGMAQQCVGGLLGFLFGLSAVMITGSSIVTLTLLSLGNAFGTLGALEGELYRIKKLDFMFLWNCNWAIALLLSWFLNLFDIGQLFIVAMAASNASASLRPFIWVIVTEIQDWLYEKYNMYSKREKMKEDVLPSTISC